MAHPKYSKKKIAKTIDHSLLKPEMTRDEVRQGCEIAKKYDVASVCCKPSDVAFCAEILKGTDVEIGTVVGFPHGSSTTATKVFETKAAIADGATEIDMVLNIGLLKSGLYEEVKSDIKAVVDAAGGKMVKVILENAYLTDDEKVTACKLCEAAGAHYVKTSSGYAPTGATVADVKLMRASVSPKVKVKSAGGVRTLDALIEMLDAGIERSGATTTSTMLDEYTQRFGD
ncbi:MAG: deoxyribose-phosphate aldolase [Actinomycetales bacterium]|jgi:deoxyribose-phosphate aldolase|nr:deoxyribose-phosphate aldolase [Actinomycetales bacterium]